MLKVSQICVAAGVEYNNNDNNNNNNNNNNNFINVSSKIEVFH